MPISLRSTLFFDDRREPPTADPGAAPVSAAAGLERDILELTRRASRLRFVRGRLARVLLARKGWSPLGFVRLGDYSRERLGLAGRALEEEARVVCALERLPQITAAFLGASLSWTQVRLVTTVARQSTERQWIATARGCDTRSLAARVRECAPTTSRTHRDAGGSSLSPQDTDEEPVRFAVRVSREGRRLWRAAREMAERSAGSVLTPAQVLELVVAEAASGAPRSGDGGVAESHGGAPRSGDGGVAVDESHGEAPLSDDERATGDETSSPGLFAATTAAAPSGSELVTGRHHDPELEAFLEDLRLHPHDSDDPACIRASAPEAQYDRDPALTAFLAELRAEKLAQGSIAASPAGMDTAVHVMADEDDDDARLQRHLVEIARTENLLALILPERGPSPTERLEALFDRYEAREPFTLDARMREVGLVMQRIDADLGRLLRLALERHLYRDFGFKAFADYVQARLDFCPRKAWTLVAVERAAVRCGGELATAYREGRLSLLATWALLPVIGSHHAHAWIERASVVTLRRLEAEVAWALDRRDAATGSKAFDAPAPPPLDHDLRSEALSVLDRERVQMRAQGQAARSASDAVQMGADGQATQAADHAVQMRAQVDLQFFVPADVAALAEDTMLVLRQGSQSRGFAFERMVAAAVLEWMSAPTHRDPVFERDGWRCVVPGCGSRCSLHDHHILFRSHGGDNALENRVAICAAHHNHSLHTGRIRARGSAPSAIIWELGCRQTVRQPLARLLGDRYIMRI